MDRLTSLDVFVAAVEEGSFAAAARRFGISPAMAGKHVSEIEARLGARLLQRTTRRLSLTEAGLAYFERSKQILEAFDEANKEASDAQGTARGTLRIAAPVTFGERHLGQVIARYADDHPRVNVDVVLGDHYVDLLDAGIDVAIRIGRLKDPSLVTRRIAPCRTVVCASPEYLNKHGTPRKPDELLQAPRLAFSEAVSAGDWTLFDAKSRAYVIDGPSRISANNMQLLLSAALAGAGIAYGPTFVFGEHLRRGDLVPLLSDFRTSELVIQAVYPSARLIPFKVRRFVDYLIAAFGDEPPWDEGKPQ